MTKPLINLNQGSIVSHREAAQPILTGVNIELSQGEILYILGRVGSGKSSLLRTLYGENPLMGGTGDVCGINLVGLKQRNIAPMRQRMGIVFQEHNLISNRNVAQNLEFLLRSTKQLRTSSSIAIRVGEVLDAVSMSDFRLRMPNELSGGEKQKIAIARALLLAPRLIIADEPTGNLDPSSSLEIITLLHNLALNHSVAVIMATHSIDNLRRMPAPVMMCESGRLNHISI